MEGEDWIGGGNNGERERDNYSYEDSEQFDEDDICSMGSDEEGLRRDDWDGWNGDGERRDYVLPIGIDDIPSTSGLSAVNPPIIVSHPSHNDCRVNGRGEGRAPSAASTHTLSQWARRIKKDASDPSFPSLFSIAVKACARHLTFSALETSYNHARLYRYTFPQGEEGDRLRNIHLPYHATIPHDILMSILECCFPEGDDDIRLYCCLANGSVDEFNRGHFLYKSGSVENVMQIGYLLTADVFPSSISTRLSPSIGYYGEDLGGARRERQREQRAVERRKGEERRGSSSTPYKVSLGIDRCRVVSCECECGVVGWCHHMVAVCLYRIHEKSEVEYRGTMWDSINELDLHKCRKLSQWLVNELPRKFIPVAQRLLDGLKDSETQIFQSQGAPDPTDGGHEAISRWFMSTQLSDKVANSLYKFCQPSPTVHCDVNLLSTPPAVAAEWSLLLQPLKSKKPEGIWNLLSIARALFKKRDANASSLLHVITDQVLASTHVLMWWLITSLEKSGKWTHSPERKSNPLMNNYEVPQLCGAALCDEIVDLWRVAALNPAMKQYERRKLASIIQLYHKTAVERLCKLIDSMGVRGGKGMDTHNNIFTLLISTTINENRAPLSNSTIKFTKECFPGFFPALQACHLQWSRSELSSLPPDATFSLDSSLSPYLPQMNGVLRRPYTVASMCSPNPHYYQYGMVDTNGSSKKKKKNKKKEGKSSSSKKSWRQQMTEAFEQFDLDELESAESGQESDKASTSTGEKKGRGSSSPNDDLDLLFAAAHSPLEGIQLKLSRCQALFSHGHTSAAALRAGELVCSLMGNTPSFVWGCDKYSFYNGDSSISNAIPITSTKHSGCRGLSGNVNLPHLSEYFRSIPHSSHGRIPVPRNKNIRMSVTDVLPSPIVPPLELPNAEVHDISQKACDSLERALILARQLGPISSHRHSIFRLLIHVLQRPKGAMSTSQLQVKLFHLESEILGILNQMPLEVEELKVIREEATTLARLDLVEKGRENVDRGVPPVSLAIFLFNSLVYRDNLLLGEEDEDVGLCASLYVLGARHSYPEASFPMLGECLRRQKGELTLTLIKRYKDESQKLGLILDRLLDSSQHRMYKYHKSNGMYFLERDPLLGPMIEGGEKPTLIASMAYLLKKNEKEKEMEYEKGEEMEEKEGEGCLSRRPSIAQSMGSWESGGGNGGRSSIDESEESGGGDDRCPISNRRSSDEGNESSSNSLSHATPSSRGTYGGKQTMASNHGIYKGNKKTRPSPFEAHSHYMVDLSKRILVEAGGDDSSSVFIHAPNVHGPHRKLLMCSFLTGLYALGLSNKASHNWTSRTYSTHSGCLSQQALSIGSAALSVMKDTWSLHFTPSEAASLADKAGNLNDPSSVDLGAELALSVLSQSHALSCTEGIRALEQCREKGYPFLEKAIFAVEEESTREEVFPEILFHASRIWADTVFREDPSQLQSLSIPPPPPPPPPPPSTHPLNPFYHAAAAIMQHSGVGVIGSGSVPPPSMHNPPSSSSSNGLSPLHRPIIHLSHSAPNLKGVITTSHSSISSLPPIHSLPTQYDPRLERLARAQRIGLKAMESMAKRGGEEDKKYSKDPPNVEHLQWLFRLSAWMGTHFILLFCEMCCKTVNSPHLLSHLVTELLKIFPNVHHGNVRLANTSFRPPQGMGQGKYRTAALSLGWQPPIADVFDRAMESAFEAIAHRIKPTLLRLSPTDAEEILDILTRMKTIIQPHSNRTSWLIFEELASHCLKNKAVKSTKDLYNAIQSLIYPPQGGIQYPFQG